MAAYISIEVKCEKCEDVYGVIVERELRNDPLHCERCGGGMANRIWSVPNVSTAKTSSSIPDVVASKRFDGLRDQMMVKKELSKAKKNVIKNPSSGNKEELRRARIERAKTK